MIFFINGASCTGKTSLARALQDQWRGPGPLLYWSLDRVISQLPFQFTGAGIQAEQGFPLITDANGAEVAAGPVAHRLNRLSADYVANLAKAGFDVVVDFVALEPALLVPYQNALAAVPVGFVGLFCDDEELDRRNQQRPDRTPGLARRQQRTVHFCRSAYDLELNSTTHDATDLAARVIRHFANDPPASGM